MKDALQTAWEAVLRPILLRPKRVQVAALCFRSGKGAEDDGPIKQVLLITSRGTGRWILPKGWPIDGKNGPESALQEAWEEAGVTEAEINPETIGQFDYDKLLDSGGITPVETQVDMTRVRKLSETYPEADQRERRWFSPADAATQVQEPELQALLRSL